MILRLLRRAFRCHALWVQFFNRDQQREIRALVADVVTQTAGTQRRERSPRAEHEPAPCAHAWLPVGQLLATEADVMRALTIGETKLDELVTAGLLHLVRIDSAVRFHPADVEALVERLRRERTMRTGGRRG